jgi:23S rRNA pseudouridine1911/1915/1917 synthase
VSGALHVLHCDNHVLAVCKPAGLPTVPDASADESLLDRARRWVEVEYAKPGRAFLGVVHRLDRPVSGVVVFARTSKAAARLTASFRAREVAKTYWGVAARAPAAPGVPGAPGAPGGVLEQWLVKDRAQNRVRALAPGAPGARLAVTRWRVLAVEREGAGRRVLLELVPATGRAHQLRVAAASLGAPLLGDLKYGAAAALPDKSVALHARELILAHPTRADELRLACEPPPSPVWRFSSPHR